VNPFSLPWIDQTPPIHCDSASKPARTGSRGAIHAAIAVMFKLSILSANSNVEWARLSAAISDL
jgi:hypothetical protein